MKRTTVGTLLLVAVLLAAAVPSTFAQLGDCDNSSFAIQNLGTSDAQVTVTFYDEVGAAYTPTPLDGIGTTNPFTLGAGDMYQVYVPGIPGFADGRYSVVIESTEPVAAIANLIGYTGSCGPGNFPAFNGSYTGFDEGNGMYYLPSVVYQYYNWNSLISIQNTTADPINVTITVKDPRGNPDKTHTWTNIPGFASVHLDLETEGAVLGVVSGLNGSAIIESSNGQVAVTDNQTAYGGGFGLTQSYNGFASGNDTLYVPALYEAFYNWNSSINIQNIDGAPTDVTVTYDDGTVNDKNNLACLGALAPGTSCLVYMPSHKPAGATAFAATITNSAAQDLVAIANAANGKTKQSQTYNGFLAGSDTVGLPIIMKGFYNWNTSFRIQNVGGADTTIQITYSADPVSAAAGVTYVHPETLSPGEAVEVYQPADGNLTNPNWTSGSVTVVSLSGEPIAGIVNQTNAVRQQAGDGDWSMSYNGQNR
jgi:hypothetical protein